VSAERATRWWWSLYSLVYDLVWDGPIFDHVGESVLRHLRAGLPVVEVGAGTGLVTRRLVDGGHDVRATEPASSMARRLRARVPEIEVEEVALEDLALPGSAHNVVAVNVLHFVPDAERALTHLRLLAGGAGRVVVVTPCGATLGGASDALRQAGVTPLFRARFVVLHLLLLPLFVIARPSAGLAMVRGLAVDAELRDTMLGLFDVLVFPGVPSPRPDAADSGAMRHHDHTVAIAAGAAATTPPTMDE
jgi:SAM-dependent methyltransferase